MAYHNLCERRPLLTLQRRADAVVPACDAVTTPGSSQARATKQQMVCEPISNCESVLRPVGRLVGKIIASGHNVPLTRMSFHDEPSATAVASTIPMLLPSTITVYEGSALSTVSLENL
jgi:hypothetical protein